MNDISFQVDDKKFNYHVAALIVDGNRYLLQTNPRDNFWSMMGGRAKFNETSKETLIREINEELGIVIKKEEATLIHIVENFFDYDNKKFHEMLFIYRVDCKNYDIVNQQDFYCLDKDLDTNHWYTFDEVQALNVRPQMLKEILLDTDLKHSFVVDN